jgi:hypothetical protein
MQKHVQQRPVELDLAVVLYEAELPKFVHEEIDMGATGANHLRERFLCDLGYNRIWSIFLAAIRSGAFA